MKDLHDVETRVTDYATGGEKGAKMTRLGALDPLFLIELGRVAGMGAEKYSSFNYLKGFDWSLAFNAAMRHALLFWSGEDIDYCTAEGHPVRTPHEYDPKTCNGSGLSHAAHAAWMFGALVSFAERSLGTDDRFKQPESAEKVIADMANHWISREKAYELLGISDNPQVPDLVLGHPIEDVVRWKAEYDKRHPAFAELLAHDPALCDPMTSIHDSDVCGPTRPGFPKMNEALSKLTCTLCGATHLSFGLHLCTGIRPDRGEPIFNEKWKQRVGIPHIHQHDTLRDCFEDHSKDV